MSSRSSTSSARRVLPLTWVDRLLVCSFATFFVIGCVVDWINAIAPAHGGITPKNVDQYNWPPRPVFDIYWSGRSDALTLTSSMRWTSGDSGECSLRAVAARAHCFRVGALLVLGGGVISAIQCCCTIRSVSLIDCRRRGSDTKQRSKSEAQHDSLSHIPALLLLLCLLLSSVVVQLWIKYLSVLSPFVFCPFYLVAICAIVTRREWIRIPIIIYASILFVDLSAFFVEAIWGELPSPNMWIFTAGYGENRQQSAECRTQGEAKRMQTCPSNSALTLQLLFFFLPFRLLSSVPRHRHRAILARSSVHHGAAASLASKHQRQEGTITRSRSDCR